MKLYVAGPMRGLPEFNFPAFDRAAEQLTSMGHEVFSPAERDRANGLDVTGRTGNESSEEMGFNLRAALRDDLDFICDHAEGVILLPGWATSTGVAAEHATAIALGIPVWRYRDFMWYGEDARIAAPGTPEIPDDLFRSGELQRVAS